MRRRKFRCLSSDEERRRRKLKLNNLLTVNSKDCPRCYHWTPPEASFVLTDERYKLCRFIFASLTLRGVYCPLLDELLDFAPPSMRNVHSWRREAEQCFHSEHLDLLSCLTECFCSQIKTFCQSDAVRKLTTTLFSCLFCFFWNIFFSQHFIYFPFLTANMATKAKPTLNQHTGGAAGLWMEGQKVPKNNYKLKLQL